MVSPLVCAFGDANAIRKPRGYPVMEPGDLRWILSTSDPCLG